MNAKDNSLKIAVFIMCMQSLIIPALAPLVLFYILDSKVLSEEKREELFSSLSSMSEVLGWKVEVLSPSSISNSMLQRCERL